ARLRSATSVADVVNSTEAFATAVSAQTIRVELEPKQFNLESNAVAALWRTQASGGANHALAGANRCCLARFELPDALGRVEVEWRDGRVEVDRDEEIAMQALCGHIAHALRRVAPDVQHLSHSDRPIWAP